MEDGGGVCGREVERERKITMETGDDSMTLRDQLLELLPEDSPCRYQETGVSVIDEVRDVFRDLVFLVDQIRKSNPVDDHGHDLKMNVAFIACTKWVRR